MFLSDLGQTQSGKSNRLSSKSVMNLFAYAIVVFASMISWQLTHLFRLNQIAHIRITQYGNSSLVNIVFILIIISKKFMFWNFGNLLDKYGWFLTFLASEHFKIASSIDSVCNLHLEHQLCVTMFLISNLSAVGRQLE